MNYPQIVKSTEILSGHIIESAFMFDKYYVEITGFRPGKPLIFIELNRYAHHSSSLQLCSNQVIGRSRLIPLIYNKYKELYETSDR